MQAKSPMVRYFAYKYGIIISIITITLSMIIHFMDLTYSSTKIPQIVNSLASTICIIIAIVSFRSTQGLLSIEEAVKIGSATALISAIIIVAYLILYGNVIEPDFFERLGNEVFSKQIAEDNPDFSIEEVQNSVSVRLKFFYPAILIIACLHGLFVGFLTGLFAKRNKA